MNKVDRAARSKELLGNIIFNEAMAALKADLIGKLETVGFDDIDKQHELTLCLQVLKNIRSRLERWVADGTLEQKQVEQTTLMDKMRQRWKG